MLQENVNRKKTERYNVVQKLRVINDDKKDGYLLTSKDGKYFIINKHEKNKKKYKRNDIVFVWVTHNHPNYSYVKLTISDKSILEIINEIPRITLEDIEEMLYGELNQDFKHFLTTVMDYDKGIVKSIKDGGIRSFDIDVKKNLELAFVRTSNMIVKHYILVLNYLYKKFKNKTNLIVKG